MKIKVNEPPRIFRVAPDSSVHIKDCAHIELEADEQITLMTKSGTEYDIARKSWGYYATPSLNARLRNYHLRAALIKNTKSGKYNIFLMEEGREAEFQTYLKSESLVVLHWLDSEEALARFEDALPPSSSVNGKVPALICLCGSGNWQKVFTYECPPKGENLFGFSKGGQYFREVFCCWNCGHFVSQHQMDESALYRGEYVNSAYRDAQGLRDAYERINAFDDSASDNAGRVRRVVEFSKSYFHSDRFKARKPAILDVGSGLCVFLGRMKREGWDCTALDPDSRAIDHAKTTVLVNGICTDFMTAKALGSYDVIAFNKVLEHVKDPVMLLSQSAEFLKNDGFVYIELPDGEEARHEGPGREEFFIEHHHIFSMMSLAILASKSGFTPLFIERLREPSGKFTLRSCLTLKSK